MKCYWYGKDAVAMTKGLHINKKGKLDHIKSNLYYGLCKKHLEERQ